MDFALMMMRLGTSIVGSNFDLTPIPRERDEDDTGSDGAGDSDDTEDEDGSDKGGSEDDSEGDSGDDSSGDDSEGDSGDDSSEDDSEGDSGDDSSEDDSEGDSGDDSSGDDSEDDSSEDDSEDDSSEDEDGSDSSEDEDGSDSEDDSEEGASEGVSDGVSDDKTAGGLAADRDDDGSDLNLDALLDALQSGENALMDNAEALREALWGDYKSDVLKGEQEWRPERPDLDRVVKPRGDFATAMAMRTNGALLTAAIMGRFRAKFLAARRPKPFHGVKYGRGLSERRLVDTMVEIKSGIRPTRPEFAIHKGDDVSLAMAIVGDQSGSMSGEPAHYAALAMLSLADAFGKLGSPVMACGVRDASRRGSYNYAVEDANMERPDGSRMYVSRGAHHQVCYDVFKDWDEDMRDKRVVSRFSSYKADGGTPLSDGVAFALESISQRPERHRVIVVLTDGCPNNPNTMHYLVRKAKEAGITVVGVGIGSGMAGSLMELYPEHNVAVGNLTDLAPALVTQIESIVFPPRGGKKADLGIKVTA